jgi:replicative DNA helicase
MPPQSLEAERAVLGALLLNPEAVGTAIEVLHEHPEDVFYVRAHQHIYAAVIALFDRGTPVDSATLVDRLSKDGTLEEAGGVTYIADLAGAVPTSANVEYYASIVLESALLRKLIQACTSIASEAYTGKGEASELLDRAESAIFQIAQQRQLNPIYPVADLVKDGVRRIEMQIGRDGGITGLPTGFEQLDELLSGMQPSDMIVLAARPSVGKTAFALNVACHIATRLKKSALLFSLEMAKEQLVQRLLCMEGQVDSGRLRSGFLARDEFPKVQRAAAILSQAEIYIDDTPSIGVLELRSKARRHKSQHNVDLVIIDYLQLMTAGGRNESRQVEIAAISRSIKGIARELSVPVIALSQLNREADKDDTGTPKLSHLRESGAIEQDADVVLMLSRPPREEGRDNVILLTVAKQRNGPTGSLELLFDKNLQRFRTLAGGIAAPPIEKLGREYDGAAAYEEEEDDVPF